MDSKSPLSFVQHSADVYNEKTDRRHYIIAIGITNLISSLECSRSVQSDVHITIIHSAEMGDLATKVLFCTPSRLSLIIPLYVIGLGATTLIELVYFAASVL